MEFFSFVLLCTLVFGAGWGLAAALLYPRLRSRVLALRPVLRARLLLGWAVAPPTMGLSLTLLLFLPYSPLSFSHGDHCSNHPGLGPHLLQAHAPLPEGVALPAAAVIPPLAGAALFFLLQAFVVCRGWRARHNLRALGRPAGQGVWLIASDRPLALSAGFIRPRVYISSALQQGLSQERLRIVLAHERAHVRRRDSLRQYLAEAGSFLHLPRMRKLLLSDMALAAEQACDEVAALEIGDRLRVAETIVTAERLLQSFSCREVPAAAFFLGNHSVARVEALLEGSGSGRGSLLLPCGLLLVATVTALAFAEPLHHGAEAWLGRLLG